MFKSKKKKREEFVEFYNEYIKVRNEQREEEDKEFSDWWVMDKRYALHTISHKWY